MSPDPLRSITRAMLVAALIAATAAHAGLVTHTVDTTGKPVWSRPLEDVSAVSTIGTAVPYDAYRFTVGTAGTYTFQTAGVFDTFTFLYSPSFAAGSPLVNARIGNDDLTGVIGGTSGFSFNLLPATDYYFVTTGFANTDRGLSTTQIGGPGTIVPAVADAPVAGDPRLVTVTGGTAGLPTFNRPLEDLSGLSGVGTATAYSAYRFTVGTSGTYQFLTTGGFDTFDVLYSNFDPSAPLANAIVASDDGYLGAIGTSSLVATLMAGVTYTLVTTGFANTDVGAFVNTIVGPGAIVSPRAVGEPATVTLAFMGLAGLLLVGRRRAGGSARVR